MSRNGRGTRTIDPRAVVFPSALGWFCLATQGDTVCELTFGHENVDQAVRAMTHSPAVPGKADAFSRQVASRLRRFVRLAGDDFLDLQLNLDGYTDFQRAVVERCRRIGIGTTVTYGELARQAGSPGAARAVGQVMANNRFPLIVPCHRVVGCNGSLGGYSARQGLTMKRRLLELEGALTGENA